MELNFEQMEFFEKDIQAYLNKSLSFAEKTAFEQSMSENEALKEEVMFRKKLQFVHQNEEEIKFDLLLQEVIRDTPTDTNDSDDSQDDTNTGSDKGGSNLWNWLLGGMLLVGVIGGLGYFLTTSNEVIDYSTIYNDNFEPYENILNFGTTQVNPLTEGMRAYDGGDYQEAIRFLEIETQNNTDEVPLFYLGLSYLQQGNTQKAITIFRQIDEKNTAALEVPSKWYLGLSLLKENRGKEAKKIFKEMPPNNPYQEKIDTILEKL